MNKKYKLPQVQIYDSSTHYLKDVVKHLEALQVDKLAILATRFEGLECSIEEFITENLAGFQEISDIQRDLRIYRK